MTSAPERFSDTVRARLVDVDLALFLSAASAWEIAIKYSLGRLSLPDAPARYVPDRMQKTRVTPLAISHAHALRVSELPLHHRDPFGRLLVAQAQLEGLPILTADRALKDYDVETIEA